MKKFISKIQNLSERAAQLQAAVQKIPPKFEQIREAVTMTTGQLQQLRSEIQYTVDDLKADTEEHLLESLREINSSVEVFQKAGYDLGGVDMELSPVHRLIVHLHRMQDVPPRTLQSLLSANKDRRITRAILSSLIRAEETAEQVDLTNLVYYKLIVNVGPIPAVRLCWKTEEESFVETTTPMRAPTPAAKPTPTGVAEPASSFTTYGQSSFFERRAPAGAQSGAASTSPSTFDAQQTAAKEVSDQAGMTPQFGAEKQKPVPSKTAKDWGRKSLERFKKMPDVSKYRR